MIVHELKTIFIHIPKTAGISLTHAIMSHVVGHDTSGEIGHLSNDLKIRFDLRGKQKHKQARDYVPADISQKLWDEYYKFAFVRNPWDRVVSEYHWRHERPSEKHKPPKDFDEFLKYCEKRLSVNRNSSRDIYWTHGQTQKSYVTNLKGEIILDDIFKFEDMNNSIQIISEKLGFPIEMKKHNSSKHRDYRDYYNERTKSIVKRLYYEDIELFGYEF
jgi:hypothetical protein